MQEDISMNVNAIVAEFISSKINGFVDVGKSILKGANEKISLMLDSTYSDYLKTIWERYSKSKSFFIRNEPVPIYNFYVPMGIELNNRIVEERTTVFGITEKSNTIVLTGPAGSGKSMMLKHLFIDSLVGKYKVPVFVELRQFNQSDLNLFDLIVRALAENKFRLDQVYLRKAMEAGHFIFLLDGFDEIDFEKRKKIAEQIKEISTIYSNNSFIVSSRPDKEFSSWPSFIVHEISKLSKSQACELIGKLPYDSEIKQKFLMELATSLYEKHTSFLSNPLLLSIMLLTYGQSADIPTKLSVFYNQAFEALFQRHDTYKGAYQRTRFCQIDVLDFAKIFSAFAIQTYDKRVLQFTEIQGVEYIRVSQDITRIRVNASDYLIDAVQSVCLLVEDGLMLTFSHRSFQEYFVARFISDQRTNVASKLMEKYQNNIQIDGVFKLLHEINPDLVEREFILPQITKLFEKIGVTDQVSWDSYLLYLQISFSTIELEKVSHLDGKSNVSAAVADGYWSDFLSFVNGCCTSYVAWNSFDSKEKRYEEFLEKYLIGKDSVLYKTSDLKSTDEFLKDLSSFSNYFSIETLDWLMRLRKYLIEKSCESDSTLKNILFEKKD